MVCPSCGSQIAGQGKFCATCGAKLPEAAPAPAPVAPPAWSQAAPPPPPAQPPAAPFGDPRYPAAGQFPAQYSAPQYPAPQYGAPQYGAPQWGAPAAARPAMASAMPIGGVLALAGGAVAIVAAWLPWMTGSGASVNAMDATDMTILECGYYLLIGGGIAAACGLLLLLRLGNVPSLSVILGVGAIAGGALVIAVEVLSFGKLNDAINAFNAYGYASGAPSLGFGLWVGIGAGVVAALGGVMSLGRR